VSFKKELNMVETRIRVSITEGELEIQGSQEYVETFRQAVDTLIDKLGTSATTRNSGFSLKVQSGGIIEQDTEFPEALLGLPSSVSGGDQLLVASWFVQQSSTDNTFSTVEANKLLVDQGIKLANASQSNANAVKAKRVFKVGKRFRLSSKGDEYVRTLLGG
jgi:SMC interacting uncharacterized protein involved in chromosome segregation